MLLASLFLAFCKFFQVFAATSLTPPKHAFIQNESFSLFKMQYLVSGKDLTFEMKKIWCSFFFEMAILISYGAEDLNVAAEIVDHALYIYSDKIMNLGVFPSGHKNCWNENIKELVDCMLTNQSQVIKAYQPVKAANGDFIQAEFDALISFHYAIIVNLNVNVISGKAKTSAEGNLLRSFVARMRGYGPKFVEMLPLSCRPITTHLGTLRKDLPVLREILNGRLMTGDREEFEAVLKEPRPVLESYVWSIRRETIAPQFLWSFCRQYRINLASYVSENLETFNVPAANMLDAFSASNKSVEEKMEQLENSTRELKMFYMFLKYKFENLRRELLLPIAVAIAEIEERTTASLPFVMDVLAVMLNRLLFFFIRAFNYGKTVLNIPLLTGTIDMVSLGVQTSRVHALEVEIKAIFKEDASLASILMRVVEFHHACHATLMQVGGLPREAKHGHLFEKLEVLKKFYIATTLKKPSISIEDLIDSLALAWPILKCSSSGTEAKLVHPDLHEFLNPKNDEAVKTSAPKAIKYKGRGKKGKGKGKKAGKSKKQPKKNAKKPPAGNKKQPVQNPEQSSSEEEEASQEAAESDGETSVQSIQTSDSTDSSPPSPTDSTTSNGSPVESKWGKVPLAITVSAPPPVVVIPPTVLPASHLRCLVDEDHLNLLETFDVRDIVYAYLRIGNEVYVKFLSPLMEHLRLTAGINLYDIFKNSVDDFLKEIRLLSIKNTEVLKESLEQSDIGSLKELKELVTWYKRRVDVAHQYVFVNDDDRKASAKYHLAAIQSTAEGRSIVFSNLARIGDSLKPVNTIAEPFIGQRDQRMVERALINYELATMALSELLGKNAMAVSCGAIGTIDIWATRNLVAHQRPSKAELNAYLDIFTDDSDFLQKLVR